MIRRILAVAAALVPLLAVPVASASTSAHLTISCNIQQGMENQAGLKLYNAPDDVIRGSTGHSADPWCVVNTAGTGEIAYMGGVAPGADCMTYNASRDLIDLVACQGLASQEWTIGTAFAPWYSFADTYNSNCLGASVSGNPATTRACVENGYQLWELIPEG